MVLALVEWLGVRVHVPRGATIVGISEQAGEKARRKRRKAEQRLQLPNGALKEWTQDQLAAAGVAATPGPLPAPLRRRNQVVRADYRPSAQGSPPILPGQHAGASALLRTYLMTDCCAPSVAVLQAHEVHMLVHRGVG